MQTATNIGMAQQYVMDGCMEEMKGQYTDHPQSNGCTSMPRHQVKTLLRQRQAERGGNDNLAIREWDVAELKGHENCNGIGQYCIYRRKALFGQ